MSFVPPAKNGTKKYSSQISLVISLIPTPAAYLFAFDEEREQRGLNKIDMTSQLPNLDIYIKTLTEKVHVQLVMTMIFEKVNLIVGHGHFTVIVFQTGFVNNQAAIGHHIFAEVGFFAFHSASNAEIRPDFPALFHILLGKVSGEGRFTSAGDSKVEGKRNRF